MKMRTKLFVLFMSAGLFSTAADAASSGIGHHVFRRSPAARVVIVNFHNDSNGAVTKAVVETRFEFNDRAFGSSNVSLNGAVSPGQTQALSFQIADPKDGVYQVLVWYWTKDCYGTGRIPASGDKFSVSSGSTCPNSSAKGVSPREAQIAEAVNDKYSAAAAAYTQKNYAVAVANFDAALRIDPKHEQSLHFRGHSFLELGKTDQAVADFTAAIAVSKNKEHLYLDRAKAYQAAKNSNAMVADYTRAIAVNPSVSNYELRGKEYLSQKKYDLAAADYTRIIELMPKSPDAYYRRGRLLLLQGKNELAAADFTKVTELAPKSWQGYYELGWLLFDKDSAAASAHFTKALEFAPADPSRKAEIFLARGSMQTFLGNLVSAKADFEQAIQHDPKSAPAYFNLGVVLAQSNPVAAVENYTKAINLDPKKVRYLLQRAELYSKQGKADLAEADITMAIGTDPNSAQPYALRAVILCNQGKKDLAAADEAKVIALGGTLKEKCW